MTADEIISIAVAALKRIAPDMDPTLVALDDDYRKVLEIDSFDALRFITEMSERCSVDIPEAAYSRVSTLRGLAEYIQSTLLNSQQ